MALAAAASAMPAGFERVPDGLEQAALMKLRTAYSSGKEEAQVNMRSQHPLAKWGRDKRQEKKAKAKIAAASRRKNRNGKR